jgi:hypothetical protein
VPPAPTSGCSALGVRQQERVMHALADWQTRGLEDYDEP